MKTEYDVRGIEIFISDEKSGSERKTMSVKVAHIRLNWTNQRKLRSLHEPFGKCSLGINDNATSRFKKGLFEIQQGFHEKITKRRQKIFDIPI